MKQNKLIRFFAIAAMVCTMTPQAFAVDRDMPKVKRIKIEDLVTRLVVDILPGRGVKCIFPWILDENSFETPFKSTITNGSVFEQERGDKQNYLIFKISSNAKGEQLEGEVSDGFISVAGYHFDLTLRINFSKAAHYSTVIFQLSDAKKIELVDDAIQKRRLALEKAFAEKEKALDERARQLALKTIARTVLIEPKKTSVYEKESLKTQSGDRIIFKADEVLSYGDMHILKISAENDGRYQPTYINGVQIEKAGSDPRPLLLEYEIVPRLDPGQTSEGFVVTKDPRMIDGHDTTMKLMTDKGEVVLRW